MNEIEKELEKCIKISIEDFKERIIEKAVCINKDESKKVIVTIYPTGSFHIIKEKADSLKMNGEMFQYKFNLIEPWEVDGYEGIIETEDGIFINMDNNMEYGFEDEFLEDLKGSILGGDCEEFNEQWEDFLNKYDKWRKEYGKC
jgi:hypothetical protein